MLCYCRGMDEHKEIPYYHNNIPENTQKVYALLHGILQKYGVISLTKLYQQSFVPNEARKEFFVNYCTLEWEDSELQIKYYAGCFVEEADNLLYSGQIEWVVEEQIGDEVEIKRSIYATHMDDNGHSRVQQQSQTLQLTKAHEEEERKWKAEQDAVRRPLKKGQVLFYVVPNWGTDEIDADLEMKIYFLEKAESLIRKRR